MMMQHSCKCHLEVVQHLVEVGADQGQTRNDGATPLFMTVRTRHLDIVHHLVEIGIGKDEAILGQQPGMLQLKKAAVPKPSCAMVPLLASQHCHGEVAHFQAKFGTKSPPTSPS